MRLPIASASTSPVPAAFPAVVSCGAMCISIASTSTVLISIVFTAAILTTTILISTVLNSTKGRRCGRRRGELDGRGG